MSKQLYRRGCSAFVVAGLIAAFAPAPALACACGCDVFEVGANTLLPAGQNLFAEYDFMDQHRNWSGTANAPAAANDDKQIKSDFLTLGGEYMLDEDWSVMADVPFANRLFKTDTGHGVGAFQHARAGRHPPGSGLFGLLE